MSQSKTPLSNSARRIDRYGMEYVSVADCRAIETRLNACVEALECMITAGDITPNMIAYHDAQRAIAGSRKPL